MRHIASLILYFFLKKTYIYITLLDKVADQTDSVDSNFKFDTLIKNDLRYKFRIKLMLRNVNEVSHRYLSSLFSCRKLPEGYIYPPPPQRRAAEDRGKGRGSVPHRTEHWLTVRHGLAEVNDARGS